MFVEFIQFKTDILNGLMKWSEPANRVQTDTV